MPLIVVNRMAPPAVVAAIDVHKQDGATHCHHSKVNVCGQKGIGPALQMILNSQSLELNFNVAKTREYVFWVFLFCTAI